MEELTTEPVLGIDLGGTNVRVGRVVGARIESLASCRITSDASKDDVFTEIVGAIAKGFTDDVVAIGIGVPSVVDTRTGTVYNVQNIPSWDEVPVARWLRERFRRPVFVNNDANCFALAEKRFGKAKGTRSFLGVILGTGMAAGVVLDGRLYEGANCGAGEFGMIPYLGGNFEEYCSGQYFQRHCGATGEELMDLAKHGSEEALRHFARFGGHLAEAVKAMLYAYDPELIILGGSVSKAYRYFQSSLISGVRSFAYTKSLEKLRVECSDTENSGVLGAASLAGELRPEKL